MKKILNLSLIKSFSSKSYLCIFALINIFSAPAIAKAVDAIPSWQHHEISGSPSLRGSAIINDSLWVTGSDNSVFVSQNGGKTWLDKSVKSTIKTGFRDIELFDSQTAIIMGVGSGQSSMLYKTIDGGDKWQLLYQNTDEQGFFDSIGFWDQQTGLLLGDPVDGFYVVKKTEDGGKTWRRIAKNKLPKMFAKEAAFAASGNTLITGKNGKAYITTGGFSASIYTSNDFGESWQRYEVPLFQETQTAGGYGLALNHSGQPFVLGGDYEQRPKKYSNMATLIDGVWQKVDAGENGLRTAMSCQNNICLATGKTNSDISFDDGKSWQILPNNNAKLGDKGFYTLDANNGKFLAAGSEGKVAILSLSGNK